MKSHAGKPVACVAFLMNYKIIDEVIADPRSGGTEKLVLIIIAQHADRVTRECSPRIDTIAEESGLGKSTVMRLLSSLRKKGLIKTVRRHNKSSITRITECLIQSDFGMDGWMNRSKEGKKRGGGE